MITPDVLTASGIPVFPCWEDKSPAITTGFLGGSLFHAEFGWPTSLVGVTIPANIFVIDVDSYKGMTTEKIEQVLNCTLDWDASYLQQSPRGGSHHAFYINDEWSDKIKQGSDHFLASIGKGFDTRAAGRGYICTGEGYESTDPIGVLKLGAPTILPLLPENALLALEDIAQTMQDPVPLPTGDRDSAEVQNMLSHITATCGRDEWRTVAYALKHHYHDNDALGWALFSNWSKTAPAFADDGSKLYDPVDTDKMWTSITPEKAGKRPITIASIVKQALSNGYLPSGNAAKVFGMAAPNEVPAQLTTIELLIDRIMGDGGRPENLDALTSEIRLLQCSDIQRSALTAALMRVLKDHGLKITEKDLKAATRPSELSVSAVPQVIAEHSHFDSLQVAPVPALGNIHIQNAEILRQALFGDRLARYGPEPYWWSGRYWEKVTKHELNSKIAHAFSGSEYGKTGNIDGTDKQIRNIIINNGKLSPASRCVFFKNGVLNLSDGSFLPHHPLNHNGGTLSVDYGPGSPHPEWDAFLQSIFSEEPERITLLQELMGWCLISDNLNHQKAIALDGASRAGKGIVLNVLGRILGNAAGDITLEQLADNKTLSSLRGVTTAIDRDAKSPPRIVMSTVHAVFNKISANESLKIPLLYNQDPWEGQLNCKLIIACNGIPIMADDSGAAPGRWLVLKFTRSFLGREDLELGQRLQPETSAIAAWSVDGLRRLIANGQFTMPQSSIEESLALKESSSPLVQFADDRLEIGPDYKVHGETLWNSFKQWAHDTKNYAPNKNNFLRSLERVLMEQGVTKRHAVRINNTVKTGMHGVKLANCVEGVTPITTAAKKFGAKPL